ncbi:MAG: DedA family protein [Bacteroidaceae bacterium]|jgi:membrane protein YqaA with SNARE-associated domain|nr:DedA family protein [Bacteroidaceae bacterium]MBO6252812.1 DedA family protein [Bacteroidaceae bacterium]MBP3832474.1 DedA family protein [Bacteroidaceae bacterium]MBQ9674914.1 DedA family protein [Bacteroidaceae bacterium]
MDAFIQLMTDWGYIGMLLTAFLAGSLIPFSSELVLTGLLSLGLNPIGILIAATIGNTMGGMTCYWLGSLGKMEWIEKYFHIKEKHVKKAQAFLQGKGAWMAFFAFLPFIGGPIAVALGLMRSNLPITITAMILGKAIRYIILIGVLLSVF